jgi:hypothetical protein
MGGSADDSNDANEANSVLARACLLVGEAHALTYALVMELSSTPREEFTHKEIDALCQVTYELLNKLSQAVDCCAERGQKEGPSRSRGPS